MHRIARISLFGSALEDRDDYGDVDVYVEITRLDLAPAEHERLDALWTERTSDSAARSAMWFDGRSTDHRVMRSSLKRGLKGLTVMDDDPVRLLTTYRDIFLSDENGAELPAPAEIIRPSGKKPPAFPKDEDNRFEVTQGATYATPDTLPSAHQELPFDDIVRLSVNDLWTIKGDWPPSDDHPLARYADLHGAQHLSLIWKEDISGTAMLARTLAWARENGLSDYRGSEIKIVARSYAKSASLGAEPHGIRINRIAERVEGEATPSQGTQSITRAEVAARFSICMALGRLFGETGLRQNIRAILRLDVDRMTSVAAVPLPDLSRLAARVRALLQGENALPGAQSVSLNWDWEKHGIGAEMRESGIMTDQDWDDLDEVSIAAGLPDGEDVLALLKAIPGLVSLKMGVA